MMMLKSIIGYGYTVTVSSNLVKLSLFANFSS
jgi:hypothetical protein